MRHGGRNQAEKIDAFARLMSDRLSTGDINTRKGCIRSIIDAIQVNDRAIRIIASKAQGCHRRKTFCFRTARLDNSGNRLPFGGICLSWDIGSGTY